MIKKNFYVIKLIMFYFENICGKKVLKSSVLNGLNHFFTTRESIIKTKEPDFEELVERNRKDFCEYFGVKELVYPSQTHTSNVEIATPERKEYPDTDGLILTNKEQAIFLNFADCTPLIFYDGKICAVSHAGWRGTEGKIAVKTVEKMVLEFNSPLENIKCAIGPAISYCCYNVGEDVLKKLSVTVKNFVGLSEVRNGAVYVDLKGINRQQLVEFGLKEENIDICPYCTVCNNDLFFSYRKENATTNRHSAVVKLG